MGAVRVSTARRRPVIGRNASFPFERVAELTNPSAANVIARAAAKALGDLRGRPCRPGAVIVFGGRGVGAWARRAPNIPAVEKDVRPGSLEGEILGVRRLATTGDGVVWLPSSSVPELCSRHLYVQIERHGSQPLVFTSAIVDGEQGPWVETEGSIGGVRLIEGGTDGRT